MTYPTNLKYTKDHEWIDIAGDRGKVGITDYAQQQLGDVVYVDLPEVGSKIKSGQSFGTIESVKAVSELYSPVSGEVLEVNSALKEKPEAVNTNPQPEHFQYRHIGPDAADAAEMLKVVDAPSLDALIDEAIPSRIRLRKPLNLPN